MALTPKPANLLSNREEMSETTTKIHPEDAKVYSKILNFDAETAAQLDSSDPLKSYKSKFCIPRHPNNKSKDAIYMAGNSLGLQPKTAREFIDKELKKWEDFAVEAWFSKDAPWYEYDKGCVAHMANIVGAKDIEVTVMNSLTVNLHLMFTTFFAPNGKRSKILMEDGAFPSDAIAVKSHIKNHGLDPATSLILAKPRKGEFTIREEDLYNLITTHGDELALVFMGGVNYFTGQLFDMEKITKVGHSCGAIVGFDLAHVAGNTKLKLNEWGPDFAIWCTYKYLNSGPGGIGACFVHERHSNDHSRPRLSGWWSHEPSTRFLMKPDLKASEGATGYQISTPPILALASLQASLEIFSEVGMDKLVEKSQLLTAFMEKGLAKCDLIKVITPRDLRKRGCQLSLIFQSDNTKHLLESLKTRGIICDFREPNCIRVAPCPLYSSFQDVFDFIVILTELLIGT